VLHIQVYNSVEDTSCATWLSKTKTKEFVRYHVLSSRVPVYVSAIGVAGVKLTETDLGSLHCFVVRHFHFQTESNTVEAVQQLTGA